MIQRNHIVIIALLSFFLVVCMIAMSRSSNEEYSDTTNNKQFRCKLGSPIHMMALPEHSGLCESDDDCCSGKCEPHPVYGKFCKPALPNENEFLRSLMNNKAPQSDKHKFKQNVGEVCITDENCKDFPRQRCVNTRCRPCVLESRGCANNMQCCSGNCVNGVCGPNKPEFANNSTLPYQAENDMFLKMLQDQAIQVRGWVWDSQARPGRTVQQATACYDGKEWSPCLYNSQCESNNCDGLLSRCMPGKDASKTPCPSVTTPPAPNTEVTPAAGQRYNFAVCHDGLKKCFERDYDFTKEFGPQAKNMDEMVKLEQAKKQSVRYYGTPRDHAYVHNKGAKIDGFTHSNPNSNRIMVCDTAAKKCFDRTANLQLAGYGASNIDTMLEEEKKKGKPMLDYTLPRNYKYYK